MIKRWWVILVVVALGGAAVWGWPRQKEAVQAQVIGLAAAPGGAEFARAVEPRRFVFPQDNGPHPDFQTEWWYYTGNLKGADGGWYGFELTFFRRALLPASARPARTSDLAADQVYLAHFTVTDVNAARFQFFQQASRGAGGLAGAVGDPLYQVWLNNWQVVQTGASTYHLAASAEGVALELDLRDTTGPILQGNQGLSQKGAQPGNASYYISQPRLASTGTLRIGDKQVTVEGESWMDHEFSTSALAMGDVGWDWFALQLSDGSELMLYSLRKADGSPDEFSSGTLIHPDGTTRSLARGDFTITPQGTWKSPHSGATYPSGWKVEIAGEGLSLQIQPRLADQELRVSFTYWEGAVAVSGTRRDQALTGSGYVELTGYAGSMEGQF